MGAEGQGVTPEDINRMADETINKNIKSAAKVKNTLDQIKDQYNSGFNNEEVKVLELPEEEATEDRASSFQVLKDEGRNQVDEFKGLKIDEARLRQMRKDLGSEGTNKDQVA